MATITQIQESKNTEGQPIKVAIAYSDEIHKQVC
jgi:sulfonate dioxygenase